MGVSVSLEAPRTVMHQAVSWTQAVLSRLPSTAVSHLHLENSYLFFKAQLKWPLFGEAPQGEAASTQPICQGARSPSFWRKTLWPSSRRHEEQLEEADSGF